MIASIRPTLRRFARVFNVSKTEKIRDPIKLVKPKYFNRYPGRDFLIVATGPTMNEYKDRVAAFAAERDLVVIGCNSAFNLLKCDYIGYVNRYRYTQFAADSAGSGAKHLISIKFSDSFIEAHGPRTDDLIMHELNGEPDVCKITQEGVIFQEGTSVTLLTLVAYVMGARNVFVCGMDGFPPDRNPNELSHYEKLPYKPNVTDEELEKKYEHWFLKIMPQSLAAMQAWLIENGRTPFVSLTPSYYDVLYDPTLLDHVDQG